MDSKLFVKDLCNVYVKYSERKKLQSSMLFEGSSYISLLISGEEVIDAFQHESGKHCVQRVPPTEHGGRPHTSIISVAVLPLLENTNLVLKNNDLEINATRGKGPGGQHKNKTSSMIRAKHKPTGVVVCIDGRDQHQNKKKALRILTARVAEIDRQHKQNNHDNNRKEQLDGCGRSNKIRTYNFIKHRVVDHKLGKKTTRINDIMKGRLDLLLD